MCFASYPSDLRDDFPFQYRVNRFWPALPVVPPHIRFLYVGLTFCYRLPSSVCYLPDSAESLDLPLNGRSVGFHHIDTRALLGALRKNGMPVNSGIPFRMHQKRDAYFNQGAFSSHITPSVIV